MKKNVKNIILYIIILICFSFVGCRSNQSQSEIQEESDGQMEVSTGGNTNSKEITVDTEDNTVDTEVITADTEDITEDTEDNIANTEDTTEVVGNTTKDTDNTAAISNDNSAPAIINEDNTNEMPAISPPISNEIVFTVTSETVYTTTDVNVRSSCSLETDNIIVTLQKGTSIERIGFSEVWSKILFQNEIRYIKTTYLTSQQPSVVKNDSDASVEDFVASLDIASEINQLICVIGNGGADCTVSFHVKDENGIWKQQFSTDGDNGSKGITYNKKEGDGKTPAGLFSFTLAFGIKSDPGAKLPYRQITDYDYWIDDLESPYYNTWINSLEIPGVYHSEHLIDHSPQYNYAMNIDYNPDCTPGLGSAIFLHGYNGLGKTTGCIATSEKYVKTLVKAVDSSTMILIVPDHDDLAKY